MIKTKVFKSPGFSCMHRLLISHDSSRFFNPLPWLLVQLSLVKFSTGISPLKRYSSAANTLIPLKRLSKIVWWNPMSKRLHYLAELWQHHFFHPVFGSCVRILQESNCFQNDFELRSNRYFPEALLPVMNLILMISHHQKIITEESSKVRAELP